MLQTNQVTHVDQTAITPVVIVTVAVNNSFWLLLHTVTHLSLWSCTLFLIFSKTSKNWIKGKLWYFSTLTLSHSRRHLLFSRFSEISRELRCLTKSAKIFSHDFRNVSDKTKLHLLALLFLTLSWLNFFENNSKYFRIRLLHEQDLVRHNNQQTESSGR